MVPSHWQMQKKMKKFQPFYWCRPFLCFRLLYCPKLRCHSRHICFVYICKSWSVLIWPVGLGMLTRLESRVSIFFLEPGKGISRLLRIETTVRQQAYCERDNCHLSLHACYQSITCLLHRGRGLHTRRTDSTVVYLSGRWWRRQMFLPPGRALITLVTPLHQTKV